MRPFAALPFTNHGVPVLRKWKFNLGALRESRSKVQANIIVENANLISLGIATRALLPSRFQTDVLSTASSHLDSLDDLSNFATNHSGSLFLGSSERVITATVDETVKDRRLTKVVKNTFLNGTDGFGEGSFLGIPYTQLTNAQRIVNPERSGIQKNIDGDTGLFASIIQTPDTSEPHKLSLRALLGKCDGKRVVGQVNPANSIAADFIDEYFPPHLGLRFANAARTFNGILMRIPSPK